MPVLRLVGSSVRYVVFATQEEIEAETPKEAAKEYWRRLHSEEVTPLIVADTFLESDPKAYDGIFEFERRELL
jgi:hypothetical protein